MISHKHKHTDTHKMASHTQTQTGVYEKTSRVTIFEGDNEDIKKQIDTIEKQDGHKKDLKTTERTEHVIINNEGVDEVIHSNVKDKKDCKVVVLYYVYAFLAIKELKKRDSDANKEVIFREGDFFFVYSRHGDRFPDPNQKVLFRADRMAKPGVVKYRFLWEREFSNITTRCAFLGRYSCKTTAVVEGTVVKGRNRRTVYGIMLNADMEDQKQKDKGDPPSNNRGGNGARAGGGVPNSGEAAQSKERKKRSPVRKVLKHVPLWMEYDENDAEAANKKFVIAETTCVIKYDKDPFDKFQRDIRAENNGGKADLDDGISEPSIVDQSVCEDNGDSNYPDSVVDTDAIDDVVVDGKKEECMDEVMEGEEEEEKEEEEEVVSAEHGNGYEVREMTTVGGWSERDEVVKGPTWNEIEAQKQKEAYKHFLLCISYEMKDFSKRPDESKISDYLKRYESLPPAKKMRF